MIESDNTTPNDYYNNQDRSVLEADDNFRDEAGQNSPKHSQYQNPTKVIQPMLIEEKIQLQ